MINGMCCIAIDFLNGSGPNPETISDFIQMIWDQKPPVVVMLTRLFEKGKVNTQITMIAQLSVFTYLHICRQSEVVQW